MKARVSWRAREWKTDNRSLEKSSHQSRGDMEQTARVRIPSSPVGRELGTFAGSRGYVETTSRGLGGPGETERSGYR